MRRLRDTLRPLLFTPAFGLPGRRAGQPRPFWGIVRGAVGGPNVRTTRMIEAFGNHLLTPNIIYSQSGWNGSSLAAAAKYRQRTDVPLVFNQNGWYFPGWYSGDCDKANRHLVEVQQVANHVIYQSRFCLEAGRRLTGFIPASYEVLHNAAPEFPQSTVTGALRNGRTCWLSGVFTPDAEHILRPALRAFRILGRRLGGVRLLLAGHIDPATRNADWFLACKQELARLEASGVCEWLGSYRPIDLPVLMQRVDLALHLKYKDPCPNAVIERLHCGIPHVYSKSGGTPELIGEAGIGLPVEDRWDRPVEVVPEMLADAIEMALADRRRLADAARAQSTLFSWGAYVARHRQIFEQLLAA